MARQGQLQRARTRRWWLLAAVIAAATAMSGGAEPLADRVGPTVTSLRMGAEALDKAGLPGYARNQRQVAETIQLWTADHEALTAEQLDSLEKLARSLATGAKMYERPDPRKADALKQQAAVADQAVATLRPLVGSVPTAGRTGGLSLLTVRIKAAAAGATGRIVLVEPARTFTDPSEITTYLNSAAEHYREATVVFQVEDTVTFATVRQVVNAVADAPLNGPTRIEGLRLRAANAGERLGRTPPGPLPEDLRPARPQ